MSLVEEAVEVDHIVVLRPEGSLYFANCEYVAHQIEAVVLKKPSDDDDDAVLGIVLDACSVNDWDATAIHVMGELCTKLKSMNIIFMLANVRKTLKGALLSSGFEKHLVQTNLDYSVEQAVVFLQTKLSGNEIQV